MTSQNRERGTYVYAESNTDATTVYEAASQRHATVYDAVAGLVSLKFSKDSASSGSRKTLPGQHHLGDPVLTPEEVLFSRKRAPQRYAEKDTYFAHDELPEGGRNVLPDSDMLKTVHGYASHYYEALGRRHEGKVRGDIRHVDERSMDETALLAFGILLEEAAREALGRDGDLVFTEGIGDDENESGGKKTADARRLHDPVGFEGDKKFWRRDYAKRRKTAD
ncbi:hypothetical protein VP1G_06284 [Cytospora mali]|uniref:Uncharacterized protein n=1 Tax=Cytospora mali TaxID=578113 RepID=A0A194V532_CYTMA|nr:hypothetical protein VP1G_06284 [Valsa mali var. pyri (nom. inval.)]